MAFSIWSSILDRLVVHLSDYSYYSAAVNVGSVRLCQVTKAENYYAKHLNCAIALNSSALLWMAAEPEGLVL